jgi:hypothetical protein
MLSVVGVLERELEHIMSVHHVLAVSSLYALTPGRLWSLLAILLALAAMVLAARGLARPHGDVGSATRMANLSLVGGLAGSVIGGAVVAAADGGPGTGYGIVGGFVALTVGLLAVVLGGFALARARRVA